MKKEVKLLTQRKKRSSKVIAQEIYAHEMRPNYSGSRSEIREAVKEEGQQRTSPNQG